MADTRELIMDLDTPVWDPNRFKPVERRKTSPSLRLFGHRKEDKSLRAHIYMALGGMVVFGVFAYMMFHR